MNVEAQAVCFYNGNVPNSDHTYETVRVRADSVIIMEKTNVTANDMGAQSLSGLVYTAVDKQRRSEVLSSFELRGKLHVEDLEAINYGIFNFFERDEPELTVDNVIIVKAGKFINNSGNFINNRLALLSLGDRNGFQRDRIQGDGEVNIHDKNELWTQLLLEVM